MAVKFGDKMKMQNFSKNLKRSKNAMRIMSFSRYDAPSGPLFKKFKILKLKDQITVFNCLLIHDHSLNLLPSSFQNFFLPCTDLHDTNTRSHAGSLFVPHVNSKQYGRNSIKVSSILKWNHLSQVLNQNLLSLTKTKLKITLTNHFLNSYIF